MARKRRPPFVQEARKTHPAETVEIWFQDEARFGQKGSLTAIWARRGSRPVVVRQTRYENLYLFGAANPRTGESCALLLPWVNTEAMSRFLAELATQIPPGRHVVLVLDNAGWHCAKDLVVPPCLSLLFLPPYSPELNPIENLWAYLKAHFLSNRTFDDEAALLDAGTEAWNGLTPETIQSVCHRDWICCL